jgi:ribosomal protein L29
MANKKMHDRLQELRAAGDAELDATIVAARKVVYQFRKDRLSKPVEDVKVVRNARKEVARALTIKRERELAAQRGQG